MFIYASIKKKLPCSSQGTFEDDEGERGDSSEQGEDSESSGESEDEYPSETTVTGWHLLHCENGWR